MGRLDSISDRHVDRPVHGRERDEARRTAECRNRQIASSEVQTHRTTVGQHSRRSIVFESVSRTVMPST